MSAPVETEAEALEMRAAWLIDYYNSLPEGVSSEAYAEANNLRYKARRLRERSLMPELRYYTVTQEREVKVSASSPIQAACIADDVFSGRVPEDDVSVKPNIVSPIREREIVAREDY